MDRAVSAYISGMNKQRLISFLQAEYGGTKTEHKLWLECVAQNKTKYDQLRTMRRCTIARIARTRGTI